MSAARHHDRAVRDRQRPVVGRAPDARPLRLRASTTSSRSARRSRPSCSTPSGIALAAKIRKTGQVAMTSMGEGSSNQGDVHEGLNFAAIHKLPFVFVVENNGYAISVPAAMEVSVAGRRGPRRPATASPASSSTASDVLGCYAAAREAVARARAGEGPTLIEAKVTRLTAHSSDDQQTKYRSAEELDGRARARPAAALPRAAPRCRRADRRDRGAHRRRAQGRRRRRDRLRRGRARPGPRDARCATSTPIDPDLPVLP